MKLNNKTIWRAGAFANNCRRQTVVSGPQTLYWRNLIARIESIQSSPDHLIVIVAAVENDPRAPSEQDIANAKLAALVVSRQLRWRLSRRTISTYLSYKPFTQVEVLVDFDAIAKSVRKYFETSRHVSESTSIPTPILSYLLTRDNSW